MSGNRALATRAPEEIHARVDAAAKRAEVPKATWLLEAITMALEEDERASLRPPAMVEAATPRKVGNGRMLMPRGRTFPRWPLGGRNTGPGL